MNDSVVPFRVFVVEICRVRYAHYDVNQKRSEAERQKRDPVFQFDRAGLDVEVNVIRMKAHCPQFNGDIDRDEQQQKEV